MSTLSIVVLSILASLFALLLLASIGLLVYAHILLRRQIAQFTLTIHDSGVKLDSQFARIESLIGTVNGTKITEAVQQFLATIPRQAAIAARNEKVALLIIDTLNHLRQEEGIPESALNRARESGLLPDDYAPAAPGEHYVSRSRVASSDAEALAEESELNSQSFGDE